MSSYLENKGRGEEGHTSPSQVQWRDWDKAPNTGGILAAAVSFWQDSLSWWKTRG